VKHLLLVDDSPAVRQALRDTLEGWGFAITEAENGAEALRLVHTQQVEGIFLDLTMPVLDGAGFLRGLRALGKQVPVILVTASERSSEVAVAFKLGVHEFVAKPFLEADVAAVVKRALDVDVSAMRRVGFEILYVDRAPSLEDTGLDETVPRRQRASHVTTLAQLPGALNKRPDVVVVAGLDHDGDAEAVAETISRLAPRALRVRLSADPLPPRTLFHQRCDSLGALRAGLSSMADATAIQIGAMARPGPHRGKPVDEPFYWLGIASSLIRVAEGELTRSGIGTCVELDLRWVPPSPASFVPVIKAVVAAAEGAGVDIAAETTDALRTALVAAGLERVVSGGTGT
jgi:CheY-like chemotaxis protein